MNIKKFFFKYADEAATIANVLRTILPAIPVGRQDQAKIDAAIERFEEAAEKVAEAAKTAPIDFNPKVTVKKSDVETAVAAYLAKNPRIIADLVEKGFADAKAEAEGKSK